MIELQKLLFPAKMEKEKRALYYDSKEKLEILNLQMERSFCRMVRKLYLIRI